jgi:selenoprotein W-related protein
MGETGGHPSPASPAAVTNEATATGSVASKARIEIHYCTGCRWLLRAAWFAQELLTTFESELAEVALRPTDGGRFLIRIDHELIWDRHRDGGFPDIAALKRTVRDRIAPGKPLGHTDRTH